MMKPGTLVKASCFLVEETPWKRIKHRDVKDIPGVCIVTKNYLGEDGRYIEVYSQQLSTRFQIPEGFATEITKVENAINELG